MLGWQKLTTRWLGYVAIYLQSIICALLIYALIIGGGDLAVAGCKKMGFYNYSIYNKTSGSCYFVTQLEDLKFLKESSQQGHVWAIISTYSSLVTVIMGVLTSTFAQCFQDNMLWKLAMGLNVLSLTGLCLGLVTYLFITWNVFDFTEVTPGFLALLLAIGGLFLLICILRHYTSLTSTKSVKRGDADDHAVLIM